MYLLWSPDFRCIYKPYIWVPWPISNTIVLLKNHWGYPKWCKFLWYILYSDLIWDMHWELVWTASSSWVLQLFEAPVNSCMGDRLRLRLGGEQGTVHYVNALHYIDFPCRSIPFLSHSGKGVSTFFTSVLFEVRLHLMNSAFSVRILLQKVRERDKITKPKQRTRK